ncbi:LOW QUALITY PROTEIN: OTU domain-containing protein 4 [Pyxicephalus adspersus]|uniref:LOW QUALITY PROTEIN: OTU domain-containing protein 4 n=1 Tax=Pyxicephalus adspersus TaxID=30357 RepID=UPI003B5CC469
MDGQRVKGVKPPASGASKEEAAMDAYLKSKGLYRKRIAKDGSCLFRAVAEQVLHSQARHLEIRKSCIKYLRENRALFEASRGSGRRELVFSSVFFIICYPTQSKEFVIYQEPDIAPARVTDNGFTEEVMLCFSNGNHYDVVYPYGFAENAALCQSILYELLYEKVFGVSVTKHLMKKEAFDWKAEKEIFDSDASGSDAENDAAGCKNVNFASVNGFKSHKDGKPPQVKSHSLVPASALRSLNPAVFRNVEYEVWMKSQRDQQRLDFSIAAGMQYSVGDKCKVQLASGGAFYNARIQEVVSENGPVVVFVEELSEEKVIPLKASKLVQSARVDDQKTIEENKKPPATSDEADVTVLPTPAVQQTPTTTVPSQSPIVTTWSGIPTQVTTFSGATPDSAVLQPQVTSFSQLPVSMPAVSQHLLPMPPYQDPLYPGFPVNEKGERITSPPPYSYCKNGSDLPNDKSILHFFYNLGIKAYTCPMWAPHLYLHPLHQAYVNMYRTYPNAPVYPQNSWMQEATVNQTQADPSVFVNQNEARYDTQGFQPVTLCPSAPPTSSVPAPVIGQMPSQTNELEQKHQFQPRVNDFECSQASKTIFPQPHIGQASYMGHPHIYSQVWYGYPYQNYADNTMVQHNVFIPPQDRNVPPNTFDVEFAGNSLVEGAIYQPHVLVNETRPDGPSFVNTVAAEETGLKPFLVKQGPQIIFDRPEMVGLKSLTETVPEKQVPLSAVTEIPEEIKSNNNNFGQISMSVTVNQLEDRLLRAKEESSEDEKEVSIILSGGRSRNFYNQSYGSRKFRNEKCNHASRGGYQYYRNEEAWRRSRGREDDYPNCRGYRGRPIRRRPMGDLYRQHYE